jgi:hypothetical protein
MNPEISFVRRHNRDSSVDSICTRCYQTIANASTEIELTLPETSHSCDPNGEFNHQHSDRTQSAA